MEYYVIFAECVAGTEGDGVICTECVRGYQPGGVPGTVECTPCPPDTNAPRGSISQAQCEGRASRFS